MAKCKALTGGIGCERVKAWLHAKQNYFLSSFEIISVLYFARNHVWNWNKIISAAEKDFFGNYLKIISATLNVLENIHELQQAIEIILKRFHFTCKFHGIAHGCSCSERARPDQRPTNDLWWHWTERIALHPYIAECRTSVSPGMQHDSQLALYLQSR